MKYSINWLKELSSSKLAPEKIAELLTMHSFEVESLEKDEKKLDGVIVGEILEIEKHPNADRLQVTKTSIGKEVLQIVCGAKNIAVGQKIPVATVGTKLPGGLEIKEAEIRGVKSCGMLCAEDELGLGTDHAGILILDKKAKVGDDIQKYLGSGDSSLEIKVLPDRAHDVLSHVGVAREIAVLEKKKFSYAFDDLILPKKKSKQLSVEIKDEKLCRRYIGAVMESVVVKESPKWLKERLEICGLRPINNVVDATNYVMLELGQPLHAFDFEKVSGKFPISNLVYRQAGFQFPNKSKNSNSKCSIVVRRAKKNEAMTLLDETEIELTEENLLITNGETPLALAGVMGGKDSGIAPETKTLILEAASFDAINVRRTRTALGLRTDASDRFEKELDPNLTEKALVRLIEILEHIAEGKLEGVVDVYPKKIKTWTVKLDLEYVNQLLGEKVLEKEVLNILNLLGIKTTPHSSSLLKKERGKIVVCEIPTYRVDMRTQEDLIEDIGRIWGYEKIVARPLISAVLPAKINRQLFLERKMQDVLVGMGYDEMYNYSFYGESDLEKTELDSKKHLQLANPMNPEQKYVRTSLLLNILKNVKENLKNFSEINIFEIGRNYFSKNAELIEERSLVLAKVLEKDNSTETFFALKGEVEELLSAFGVRKAEFLEMEKANSLIDSGRVAKIVANGKTIGFVGEIKQTVLAKYKISKRVVVAEINLENLKDIFGAVMRYKTINKFPVVSRDISMIVPKEVKYAEIHKLVRKIGGELVDDVVLFDRFEAKNSMAIRIEMSAKDRTLESAEIDELMNVIIMRLEKELKIEVRK